MGDEDVPYFFTHAFLAMALTALLLGFSSFLSVQGYQAKVTYDNKRQSVINMQNQRELLTYTDRIVSADDIRLLLFRYKGVFTFDVQRYSTGSYVTFSPSLDLSYWSDTFIDGVTGGGDILYRSSLEYGFSGEINKIVLTIYTG